MNLKFSLILFFLVLCKGIEGGLVPLKEPPPVLNGRQIQHVLNSDRNGGVKYSNIPVYGRTEKGRIGEDKGIGNGEGNESKTAKLNKNVQDKEDKKSKKMKNKKRQNEKAIPNWSAGNPFAVLDGLEEKWEKKENKKLKKVIEKTEIENNEEEKEEENCNRNCEEVVCEDEEEIGGSWLFKFIESFKISLAL
ncbi:unnamed protein product [Meloidogyne enterolobii]|uniref:Uncharacterized protein n=1 Tax=Meloidogyne enterolobii TaxID=390850 RepID=A0ACB1AHW0_MELEN